MKICIILILNISSKYKGCRVYTYKFSLSKIVLNKLKTKINSISLLY